MGLITSFEKRPRAPTVYEQPQVPPTTTINERPWVPTTRYGRGGGASSPALRNEHGCLQPQSTKGQWYHWQIPNTQADHILHPRSFPYSPRLVSAISAHNKKILVTPAQHDQLQRLRKNTDLLSRRPACTARPDLWRQPECSLKHKHKTTDVSPKHDCEPTTKTGPNQSTPTMYMPMKRATTWPAACLPMAGCTNDVHHSSLSVLREEGMRYGQGSGWLVHTPIEGCATRNTIRYHITCMYVLVHINPGWMRHHHTRFETKLPLYLHSL